MDSRDGSEAPSDSSSDFYSDAVTTQPQPSAHTAPPPVATPAPVTEFETIANGDSMNASDARDDKDETSSDMELSEASRPATPAAIATQPDTAVAQVVAVAETHAGSKRKLSEADGTADGVAIGLSDEHVKKRKVSVSASAPSLSPAIWQRIFTLLPPAMLCRCLRVSKEFNHLLMGVKAPHGQQKDKSTARTIDSEAIWVHSRKTYFSQLPRPLRNRTELEMLKLVGGQTCQFCGKAPVPSPATSVFNCGPGPNGVRVLFPFGVRTCGSCIEPLVRKDVQLLAEPISARLRLGITYAFRNEELHYVTETVRQIPPGIPGNLRFSKVYYHPDLVAIQHEENDAQQLGEGAADEWRKGLYNKGKDAMADSARWEKWEAGLRLGANLAQVLREYDLSSFPRHVQDVQSRSAEAKAAQSSTTINGPHPLPQPVHVFHNGYPPAFPQFQQQFARPPQHQQHPLPFPLPVPHHQLPFPPHQQHQRLVRNPQEVESARQARKAEIERRCRELEPPVEPGVLQHMESFQAAMQITTPLTDAAWDMLKPRILAQRETAEYTEHVRASQLAALQAAIPSYIPDDVISKPAKEMYDREYEDAQGPLRKRLGEYADDITNGHWGGGKMLDRDNAPIFAIQVLQHVHQRYVEDKELGLLSDLEAPVKQNGSKQGSPPPAPFLSLDNMKWVYDNKVRSFTDAHRKELFICAGCEEERKPKWFAFEGLVQHYGAKHTSTFSKGNIIVHWQTAEWPEKPPFHTRPEHWLKQDRRTSEMRKDHRGRNSPHTNHESQFQSPAAHSPARNIYAPSNGVASYDTSYAPQYAPPNGTSNGHASTLGPSNGTAIDEGPEVRHLKLANDSREIWDALDGIKDLLECIKVQTVLHHAVAKFGEQYRQRPTLDLFTDALASHNVMRPLKNVTGLACKSCVAAGQNSYSNSYWTRIRGVKLFNTSSLITHFKLMHQPHENVGPLDWVKDMIELPEKQIIAQLLQTPGMDDAKLALISAAMPGMFPTPLPTIGQIPDDDHKPSASEATFSNLLGRLNKKQKSKANKKAAQKASKDARDRDSSHEALPEPKEDEYDPLRPALVPRQQTWDPSQFDTDARKPSEPKAPVAQPPPPEFNLNPETIAMLQSLTQASQHQPVPVVDRASRSPSVGRVHAASAPVPKPPAPVPTSNVTPNGQPDIAAILAALTGQGQTATPPTSMSNRSGSVPRQSFAEVYPRGTQSNGKSDTYGTRYSVAHQAPPKPVVTSNVHELPVAVPHNHRQYEQNLHHSHSERAYSTGPQPQQHQPPPQPVPQYQYVYEDRQYAQANPHTPTYRDAPPQPQYVQVPEHEYAPHGYQYERPAPQPIYVDQYGRPLIPIDAAPAPVQYLPNPYEQQHYTRPQEQPVYTSAAPQPHLQPVYNDRRPVYYEQPAPPSRYPYDDRASVGRS